MAPLDESQTFSSRNSEAREDSVQQFDPEKVNADISLNKHFRSHTQLHEIDSIDNRDQVRFEPLNNDFAITIQSERAGSEANMLTQRTYSEDLLNKEIGII